MALFGDDKSKEIQFALAQAVNNSLFTGILLINPRHEIVYANQVICAKTGYDHGYLIGREVHILVPPGFRARHKDILTTFFEHPYRVAIEQRQDNIQNMNMVPRGMDDQPDKWLPVRIGINPVYVDPTQELFQTGDISGHLPFGVGEIQFTGTFNVIGK